MSFAFGKNTMTVMRKEGWVDGRKEVWLDDKKENSLGSQYLVLLRG